MYDNILLFKQLSTAVSYVDLVCTVKPVELDHLPPSEKWSVY